MVEDEKIIGVMLVKCDQGCNISVMGPGCHRRPMETRCIKGWGGITHYEQLDDWPLLTISVAKRIKCHKIV